ncbi:hypothetical protein OG930_18175 [Streptomyces sp. NBC_01799]|nr:hypothetical protein OG930_18175 [Streptomyces sp. NBC_01799]
MTDPPKYSINCFFASVMASLQTTWTSKPSARPYAASALATFPLEASSSTCPRRSRSSRRAALITEAAARSSTLTLGLSPSSFT